MIMLICLFFPTMIAVSKTGYSIKNMEDLISFLIKYCKYNVCINFCVLLIYFFLNPFSDLVINSKIFTAKYSIEYLVCASIISFYFPYFVSLVKANINIRLDANNEK